MIQSDGIHTLVIWITRIKSPYTRWSRNLWKTRETVMMSRCNIISAQLRIMYMKYCAHVGLAISGIAFNAVAVVWRSGPFEICVLAWWARFTGGLWCRSNGAWVRVHFACAATRRTLRFLVRASLAGSTLTTIWARWACLACAVYRSCSSLASGPKERVGYPSHTLDVAPTAVDYRPATQLLQAASPSAILYLPAIHSLHVPIKGTSEMLCTLIRQIWELRSVWIWAT